MQEENPYAILGVGTTATTKEIRQAYLRLAKTLHPDQGGEKDQFQRVTHAYETLSKPDKRRKYDAIHHGKGRENLNSILDDLIKNSHNMTLPQLQVRLKITLTQALRGGKFTLQTQTPVPKQHCDECKGSGKVFGMVNGFPGQVPCVCQQDKTIKVSVHVPANVKDGAVLQGTTRHQVPYSEILVTIEVQNEYGYDYENGEAATTIPVNVLELIIGKTLQVDVFGEEQEVTLEAGTPVEETRTLYNANDPALAVTLKLRSEVPLLTDEQRDTIVEWMDQTED